MITKLFAIWDTKAEAFNLPFFCHTNGQAIRSFTTEASNPESMLAKYPEDYALFELGTYDDSNATFNLLPAPKSLGTAQEYVTSRGQAAV